MERPEGSNEMPPGTKAAPAASEASSSKPTPTPESKLTPASTPASKAKFESVNEEEDAMEVDDNSDAQAKKEAEELKAKGTVAYKARKFDEAIELYSKAWDTYPKDVTFLTNLSGKRLELALANL